MKRTATDPQRIEEALASLESLKRPDVAALWEDCFGRPVQFPPRIGSLLRCLAYGLQSRECGGLPPATRKKLLRVAESLENGHNAPVAAPKPRIKAGTRLLREWRGETHEVTVGAKGFEYRGKRYGSLSEVARLITGTRWSGPAFFGLKPAPLDKDGTVAHGG